MSAGRCCSHRFGMKQVQCVVAVLNIPAHAGDAALIISSSAMCLAIGSFPIRQSFRGVADGGDV